MPEVSTDALNPPEIEEERMASIRFLEHPDELRNRILRALVAAACGVAVCCIIRERLVAFIAQPLIEVLKAKGQADNLVYLKPSEPFNLHFTVCALAGLFVT